VLFTPSELRPRLHSRNLRHVVPSNLLPSPIEFHHFPIVPANHYRNGCLVNRTMKSFLAFRNRLFLQLMPGDIPDNPDEANRTALCVILCCGVRSEVRFAFSSRP